MRIVEVAGGASVSPSKRARTETEERPVLKFAKLSEHATTPTRGSARAAGYDLYRFVYTAYISILFFFFIHRIWIQPALRHHKQNMFCGTW